jgi:hypothetical protein
MALAQFKLSANCELGREERCLHKLRHFSTSLGMTRLRIDHAAVCYYPTAKNEQVKV